MAKYPIKKIRPLALLGHAGSGKHGDGTCAYPAIGAAMFQRMFWNEWGQPLQKGR